MSNVNKIRIGDTVYDIQDSNLDIEYGSNANGSYIKASNGLLVCFGHVSVTIAASEWSSWGGVVGRDGTVNQDFPIPFIAEPKLIATNTSSGNNMWINRILKNATKITNYSFCRGNAGGDAVYGFDYVAIGNWK